MIKSLLEDDILSSEISFTCKITLIKGFFFFRSETEAKVPKIIIAIL